MRTKRGLRIGMLAAAVIAGVATVAVSLPAQAEAANMQTTPVTVTDAEPGERVAIPMAFQGRTDGVGVVFHVNDNRVVPRGLPYTNCGYPDNEPVGITCVLPDMKITDGNTYEIDGDTPFTFLVPEDLPGGFNMCLENSETTCNYHAKIVGKKAALKELAYLGGDMSDPVELTDADDAFDEWSDTAPIEVFTAG